MSRVAALSQTRQAVGSDVDLSVLIRASSANAPPFSEWPVRFLADAKVSYPQIAGENKRGHPARFGVAVAGLSADDVGPALAQSLQIRHGLASADGIEAPLAFAMSDIEMATSAPRLWHRSSLPSLVVFAYLLPAATLHFPRPVHQRTEPRARAVDAINRRTT